MAAPAYQNYEEAARDYLLKFEALRKVKPVKTAAVTRGAGDIPVDELINRADEIADISASMVPFSKGYLENKDPKVREGMSGQLLSQAAAELQVAAELLKIAKEKQTGQPAAPTTRAARGVALLEAIKDLEESMANPVSEGLPVKFIVTRSTLPTNLDEAKAGLAQTAGTTAGAIAEQVIDKGGGLVLNLISNVDWGTVIASTGLISSDTAKLLEKIKEGVGAFLSRLVNAVIKTLINVYDKILALLGKEVTDKTRQQVQEWLKKIKEGGRVELFDPLVIGLYHLEDFKRELKNWLTSTKAAIEKINNTKVAVGQLSEKFVVLVGRIKKISEIADLASIIKIPTLEVAITGIQVALLAALIFSGYDYIGYKQPRFPNLTKGVAEVIQENLDVAEKVSRRKG